jgi:hypothetical protein
MPEVIRDEQKRDHPPSPLGTAWQGDPGYNIVTAVSIG